MLRSTQEDLAARDIYPAETIVLPEEPLVLVQRHLIAAIFLPDIADLAPAVASICQVEIQLVWPFRDAKVGQQQIPARNEQVHSGGTSLTIDIDTSHV